VEAVLNGICHHQEEIIVIEVTSVHQAQGYTDLCLDEEKLPDLFTLTTTSVSLSFGTQSCMNLLCLGIALIVWRGKLTLEIHCCKLG
jgi:hypothetical protein